MNPEVLHWNATLEPPLYSQFAGMLAGFVFAAILLLLSNPPKGDTKRIVTSLNILVVTLLCLILASFLYGIAAAFSGSDYQQLTGVAYIHNAIACYMLAVGSMMLFYSIPCLMYDYDISLIDAKYVLIVFTVISFIVPVFVASTTGYVAYLLKFSFWKEWHPLVSDTPFLAALLFPPLLSTVVKWFHTRHRLLWLKHSLPHPNSTALTLAIAIVSLHALAACYPPNIIGSLHPQVLQVIFIVLLLGLGSLIAATTSHLPFNRISAIQQVKPVTARKAKAGVR